METTNDILCEMRTLGQIYNKSTEKITRSLQSLGLRSYAVRFEDARRRETVTICNHLNEILNEANGIAESVTSDYIEKKARRICDLCKQIDLQGNGAAMREREATCEKSSQVGNAAVAHSRGGFDYDFHDVLKRLASVCWHETMFADMQTYYAEEGVYVMRCKHGTPNAHYCIIRAKSLDEAISRAVFDLHKANESRELGVSKTETTTPTCKASLQVGNEHKPMTLDEAIAHAEEAVNDTPCGQEHKQLADWLKELREIKNSNGAECREALMQIRDSVYIDPDDNKCHSDIDASDLREICDTALTEPPRNCDVATEAEAIESLQQTIPLDGLSENDINIVTACIKDIVGALYAPYKKGEVE